MDKFQKSSIKDHHLFIQKNQTIKIVYGTYTDAACVCTVCALYTICIQSLFIECINIFKIRKSKLIKWTTKKKEDKHQKKTTSNCHWPKAVYSTLITNSINPSLLYWTILSIQLKYDLHERSLRRCCSLNLLIKRKVGQLRTRTHTHKLWIGIRELERRFFSDQWAWFSCFFSIPVQHWLQPTFYDL